jgi:predicted DCC family thiol-disulfide oxidoreductase YuxK
VSAPERPVVVFDGDCGFCRQWIARWRQTLGDRAEFVPYQEAAPRFPEIPESAFSDAVHLVEPDGRVSRGAEAVFRMLSYAPGRGWPLRLYRRLPGFAPLTEACYRLVARHRGVFTRLTGWVWGRHVVPPGETLTTWIYLRLLALVYLVAFLSLWTQIIGLAGRDGILPAKRYLDAVGAQTGALGPWVAPTLAWIAPGDAMLHVLCALGTALSLLLAIGVAPILCLVGLFVLYLSVTVPCQDFLWFQWDSLLLEAGFLAIFLAPWRWWSHPSRDPRPSRAALWLSRWLLVRLSVSSALVKLLSGDRAWRDLSALRYHFETQPLPPWTAWYVHHLPPGILSAMTVGVLVLEGAVPLLAFAPRRIRFTAAAGIAFLQILILMSGNYAFFNWLTLALCVLLLDDGVWPARWRAAVSRVAPEGRQGRWWTWVATPAAAALFALSWVPTLHGIGQPTAWMGPVELLYEAVSPFRMVNHYGLFAVMTTRRPEIILEGSDDGTAWRAYEFRYKPGNLSRRPDFVAPHQPRLDWQMWFAALTPPEGKSWFYPFCQRVLEGSPPVMRMFGRNPFQGAPPRFLRAVVYEYHFTTPAERKATGAWWTRRRLGLYGPVMMLENGNLVLI